MSDPNDKGPPDFLFVGSSEVSPETLLEMARAHAELLAYFKTTSAKHGPLKLQLATAMANAEIATALVLESPDDPRVEVALKTAFGSVLGMLGTAYGLKESDVRELADGLKYRLSIAMGDINETVQKGEHDGKKV